MRMKIFNSRLSLTIALALMAYAGMAQDIQKPSVKSATSFAIVVDQSTYLKAKKEIDDYRTSVEKGGLATYIISNNWQSPDDIRTLLKGLHQQKQSLEGVVFIGDIPIVMVRDAQYLTSTFKMNQKINWQRSSVPSDRFYDDFHLEFDFIKQDTARKDYFYYSISPVGAQKINMSIYSGRIKPPAIPGKDKYELIKEYLTKVVREKAVANKIDNAFISTSHGYNSESPNAWAGEQLAFKSQFPTLFQPGSEVRFYSFLNETFLKFNLLSALKSKNLDIAIMHGHGDPEMQLINGYPYVSNPQGSIDNLTRYLRAKVRDAKDAKRDVQKVKEGFVKSLGVSMAWMDDAFEPKVIEADSIFNDNLDIHIKDIIDTKPNARFVMLDNCFTGSFHLDEYLAGYYPFSGGDNIVAVANSIGVLQDLWPDQLMGVLQHGSRVGNWFKHTAYLESHIIGDPTFSFTANTAFDVNKAVTGTNSVSYWKDLLSKPDADLQSLSLIYLAKMLDKNELSAVLKKAYFSAPYETTRMQSFQLLKELDNADYKEVLLAATKDPYEFIRRIAVSEIAERGDKEYIPALVGMIVNDFHSERIAYKIKTALPFMDAETTRKEIEAQLTADKLVHFEKSRADLLKSLAYGEKKVSGMIDTILDQSKADKVRLFDITTMRAYRYHQTVPALIQIVKDSKNSDPIRIAALEALSWFPNSYRKKEIVAACKEIEQGAGYNDELKKQATKNIGIFL